MQADARDAIARSSMLKNKDNINVGVNGTVVTLSGTVNSETERSVAEGMVRMTPGVGDVLNNRTCSCQEIADRVSIELSRTKFGLFR